MDNDTKPRVAGKGGALPVIGLPLFDWADTRRSHPLNPAAAKVARRFGLPPIRAALIAELAGFSTEAGHAW